MKKYYWIMVMQSAVLFNTGISQWNKCNGPAGEKISSIALSGDYIFATSVGGGVFSSTDNGHSWNHRISGLNDLNVTSLVIDPLVALQKLYLATQGGSVFISTDTAKTWTPLAGGADKNSIQCIVVVDSVIVIGKYSSGIYRSLDNGLTWEHVVGEAYIYDLKVNINSDSSKIIFAATGSGLLYSTDFGKTWNQGNPGPFRSVVPINDSLIFGGEEYGLYKSTNGGKVWALDPIALPSNLTITSFSTIKSMNGERIIFAGTQGNGIFVSHDSGSTWLQSQNGLENPYINALAVTMTPEKSIRVFAGTEEGVYASSDSGASWEFSSNQLTSLTPYTMQFLNGRFIIGTNKTVFLSQDKGESWIKADFDINCVPCIPATLSVTSIVTKQKDTLYFAGTKDQGLWVSSNGGVNWKESGVGNSNIRMMYRLPATDTSSKEKIIMVTDNAIFSYTPEDHSLENQSFNSISITSLTVFSVPNKGNYIFAGTGSQGIFRSTDNGNTFLPSNGGNSAISNVSLSSISDNAGGCILFGGRSSLGFYYSTDFGSQWKMISDLQNRRPANVMQPFRSNNGTLQLAIGTTQGLIFYQQNDTGWVRTNYYLPNISITSIAVIDSFVFIGASNDGIWKASLSSIVTSISKQIAVASYYQLSQNYPNPFNPTTTIQYSIPKSGLITITVYDILGRQIETLVNERQNQGTHSINFDASKLPSGMYFYQIRTGGYTDTKKMVVLK